MGFEAIKKSGFTNNGTKKESIAIPISVHAIKNIVTNNHEKTHEFYKNSQTFICRGIDKNNVEYEYRAEVKHMRIENGIFQCMVLPEKSVQIKLIKEEQKGTFTFKQLKQLVENEISVADLSKG